MGQSTDAEIAFGVDLGEGEDCTFPWDAGDIEDWWRKFNGFVNPIPEPEWDAERTPERDAQVTAYFKASRDWYNANPLPVDLISHCSGDYPMYILAVPGTHTSASRGYPIKLDPNDFARNPNTIEFREFCEKHNIEPNEEPAWLLFSTWTC